MKSRKNDIYELIVIQEVSMFQMLKLNVESRILSNTNRIHVIKVN